MFMPVNKRGYFFTLDAFIAIGIIALGLLLVLFAQSYKPYETQAVFLSQDFIDALTSTKVSEVNNQFVFDLIGRGNITSLDNTILEQAGEFYITGQKDLATEFIGQVSGDIVPVQYGFELLVNEEPIFNRSVLTERAELVVSSKKLLFGVVNVSQMWGPIGAEVRVWQG